MSNLLPWLTKRRSLFYTGEALEESIASFLKMAKEAYVYESDAAIIVLEDYGLPGNVRAWLLFDTFSTGVVKAMLKVFKEFKGEAVYVSTHDSRIKDMLIRLGYIQYAQDSVDFWLVKQGENHGV